MSDPKDPKAPKAIPIEDDTEYICQCFQVTEQTIKESIRSGHLTTIEQITEACGAGGGCQSCHMLLQLFLDDINKPAGAKPPPPEEKKPEKKGFLGRLFSRS